MTYKLMRERGVGEAAFGKDVVHMGYQENMGNAGYRGNSTYEYTTFPRQFVTYRWFKPLMVGVLTIALTVLFQILLALVGSLWLGDTQLAGEATDSSSAYFYTGSGALIVIGGVATMLPALAIATLIVRDRPFSSYSSSRGGWNWSAFGKSLALAAIVIGAATVVRALIFPEEGADGIVKFTALGFLLCLILIPLQAIAEEYIFRGLIMQAIGAWTNISAVAIVLSTVIFAVSHSYDALGIAAVLIDGLGLAFLAWHTKGLEACCSAHIMHNLAVFICAGIGLGTTSGGDFAALVFSATLTIVYCVAVVLLDKRFGWFTPQGDGAIAFNNKHRARAAW